MPDQPAEKLIIDAIRKHRFERCSESRPGFFEWWGRCTGCGAESYRRQSNTQWEDCMWLDEAQHLADVLLALPGIAIVALPQTGQNWWPVVHGGEPEQVYLAHEPNDGEQIICISGAGYCYVDEARSVAAALLAAAGVAEEQTNA